MRIRKIERSWDRECNTREFNHESVQNLNAMFALAQNKMYLSYDFFLVLLRLWSCLSLSFRSFTQSYAIGHSNLCKLINFLRTLSFNKILFLFLWRNIPCIFSVPSIYHYFFLFYCATDYWITIWFLRTHSY
jgi:hypothetical protein